ncbi:long-chain-fatty-acid--CoA ligase [bacterium]|nr:MAG: long-chain-fatty-acid--CoA ligase [bacterium]
MAVPKTAALPLGYAPLPAGFVLPPHNDYLPCRPNAPRAQSFVSHSHSVGTLSARESGAAGQRRPAQGAVAETWGSAPSPRLCLPGRRVAAPSDEGPLGRMHPMIDPSPARPVHLDPLTPLQFLERAAFVYREKAAVRYGQTTLTYPQLYARVRRFARALTAAGIEPGDRVAVLLPNIPPMLEAHFGVPLARAVLVAINTRLLADEITYILQHSGSKLLIYDAEYAAVAAQVRATLPLLRCVAYDDSGAVHADMDYEALLAAASEEPIAFDTVDEDATISINYTSGTTGRPKGVMYTYRGAFLNALGEALETGLDATSNYLWTLPMFHCNGWCFPWGVTAMGATHVMLRKIDPALIWRLIAEEGVTHFNGAPTVLTALVNDPSARRVARPLTVATAGAPPSPRIIRQMEELGAEIVHVYGLTETYGPITVCAKQPEWERLSDSERAQLKSRQGVGYVSAGNVIRVVEPSEDGVLRDVPRDGETLGEIVMRGNNVMKGYYEDPAASARAFAGGWFHSGDLAVWHPDGYVEIRDRGKDIIISGGENISTQQVEKVVVEHPAVLEVAVVAIPDERWGEVPKAFVTLRSGSEVSARELELFCRERLPGFKVPKAFEFCDLPKTSTGKIQKFVLREREWSGRERRVN